MLARFPAFFNNPKRQHPLYWARIFTDINNLNDMVTGLCKFSGIQQFKSAELRKQTGFQRVATIDNGHCLYDAIWKGLDQARKGELIQRVKEYDLDNNVQPTPHNEYHWLVARLHQLSPQTTVSEKLLANRGSYYANYDSIDDYKDKLFHGDQLWGLHNIEGKILAEDLGVQLNIIPGIDFTITADGPLFVE